MSSRLGLNAWYLSGDWVVGREAVSLASKGGRIAILLHGRDPHLVMGSGVMAGKLRFRASVDGLPPGSSHGLDVDEHGFGTLSDYRFYQLIRQESPIKDHLLEIVFLASGAEAFSFTFVCKSIQRGSTWNRKTSLGRQPRKHEIVALNSGLVT
jgi:hypothetical protein